jgi:hypothetical protein
MPLPAKPLHRDRSPPTYSDVELEHRRQSWAEGSNRKTHRRNPLRSPSTKPRQARPRAKTASETAGILSLHLSTTARKSLFRFSPLCWTWTDRCAEISVRPSGQSSKWVRLGSLVAHRSVARQHAGRKDKLERSVALSYAELATLQRVRRAAHCGIRGNLPQPDHVRGARGALHCPRCLAVSQRGTLFQTGTGCGTGAEPRARQCEGWETCTIQIHFEESYKLTGLSYKMTGNAFSLTAAGDQ